MQEFEIRGIWTAGDWEYGEFGRQENFGIWGIYKAGIRETING